MKHRRLVIAVELTLGLVFAGLGHYFVAAWRPVYPLDGYFFYGVAVLCFILAWRTLRREKNDVWDALLALWRGVWQEALVVLREALQGLQQALPYISLRLILIVAVVLNLGAALAAYFLPSAMWLWGLAWGVTIVALVALLWPRSSSQRPTVAAAPRAAHTYAEPAAATGHRVNPIGLATAIGLLLLGQLLFISSSQPASGVLPIAQTLDEAFHLRLPGNGAVIWPGVIALVIGTVLFAIVTRGALLDDYPRLSVVEISSSRRRGLWLLVLALAGIALWLFALRVIAEGGVGQTSLWPWLIAAGVIAACWWQIDRIRGVRLRLHLDRREALLLIAALLAIFVVLAFQIGQIPNSLWGDEGAFYVQARDAARGVVAPDGFGLGTYAEPAFTTIFQSWLIALLGESVAAWRLSSVLAAWLAAIPIYFLARDTLGRRTAWVALAFYAVSPWVLTYARMGYVAAQAMWPVVLALALTWLAVRRDSRFYAFLAGCAAGLSFSVPMTARIALVLVPLWLAWIGVTRRASVRMIGWQIGAAALGMLICAAPSIVYGAAHAPDVFVGKQFESSFNNVFYARDFYPEDQLFEWYGPIQAGQQQIFYNPQLYGPLIARGLIRTALAFHLPALAQEHYLVGALAEPFGILYLLGLAWSMTRLRRPGYAIWPMWLLLGGLLAGALSAFPPRASLLLPVAPALATLAALGLTATVDVLANLIGRVSDRMKVASLIGVTLLLALAGLHAYFVEMPRQHPPDLENAMFWQAQQLPRGAALVLIQPDDLPDSFRPWGMGEFDTSVQFHLLKKDDLPTANWQELCPGACRVFMTAADRDAVLPWVTQVFGSQGPVEYADAAGAPQAYLFVAR
jgi:4-amino-4-deoxy-L-arabinose transferase-like glycosyltransferase